MSLLTIKNLEVTFSLPEGTVRAVNSLNFSLEASEILGIVGESGSGKSQMAFALMGLIPKNGTVLGSALFEGREILNLPEHEINQIRAQEIAMIFQDPMTSLNPYLRIDQQLTEVLEQHKGMSHTAARAECIRMLDAVKLPDAKRRMRGFPHEFSGGMRQRIMIAMALLCRPKLLIADEPTTALDVTVQAQILLLLQELQKEFSTAIILITHDLGVIAGICDNVLVMYSGEVMESAKTSAIFEDPQHPYTQGLLEAIPRLDIERSELKAIPGNPPNLLNKPSGCPFRERCEIGTDRCYQQPLLQRFNASHLCACHYPGKRKNS